VTHKTAHPKLLQCDIPSLLPPAHTHTSPFPAHRAVRGLKSTEPTQDAIITPEANTSESITENYTQADVEDANSSTVSVGVASGARRLLHGGHGGHGGHGSGGSRAHFQARGMYRWVD
jgi:hypothetical protein